MLCLIAPHATINMSDWTEHRLPGRQSVQLRGDQQRIRGAALLNLNADQRHRAEHYSKQQPRRGRRRTRAELVARRSRIRQRQVPWPEVHASALDAEAQEGILL